MEAPPLPIIFEAVDSLQHPGDSLQQFSANSIIFALIVLCQFSSALGLGWCAVDLFLVF
jgi:hypothetical protein